MLRTTIILSLFAILAKILGLVRLVVFSNRFGAGSEIDVYVAAFRIPDFIFNLLILGTLSAALIPVFVDYLQRDRDEAFRVASTVFNLAALVMAAAAALGYIFAPLLVNIIAPGFDAAAAEQTLKLTRILMLSPLLLALSSVATSILQSYKKFIIPALAPLCYNLSIIFGVLVLYPRVGLTGVVWAVVGGAALHFGVQVPAVVKQGMPLWRHFDPWHRGVRKIVRLYVPRILGLDIGQVGLLISSIIGSTLASGSIAVYYYAFDLEAIPLGIFGIAFATTAFPVLSGYAAKKNMVEFREFLAKTMVQLLFLIVPLSVLMIVLRAQIVRLFLGAGQNTNFSFSDTRLTALALGLFSISLAAQSVIPLLARGFYALHNTVVPVAAGGLAVAVNAILAFVFSRVWGASFMAFAFSLAAILDAGILFWILRRMLGRDLEDDFLFLRLIKICIAAVVAGTSCFVALYVLAPFVDMSTYFGVLEQTAGAAFLAGVAYLLCGIAIGLQEAHEFVKILLTWFDRFSKIIYS